MGGTEVYIYLARSPEDMWEVLPILVPKLKAFYREKRPKSSWVSGKDSEIMFDKKFD